MSWAQSLIKLSTYEVEVLQKRLAEITDRRTQAEMRLVMLTAEGEAEAAHAGQDASAGWYHIGFLDGLRLRKAEVQARIDAIAIEEAGARDALAQAFEEQKKYEQIAETARTLERRETLRRETAALDELGLRKVGGR
ncbi:flagellar FliJ family protein [Phenylobacterium sp.]|uniref:flagellar FliJ family protein n=1 Tax=Phenylobacterium sp. TaxID=1871053 RepID=UPI00398347B8